MTHLLNNSKKIINNNLEYHHKNSKKPVSNTNLDSFNNKN